jgi:PAS domain S-box-containing protein
LTGKRDSKRAGSRPPATVQTLIRGFAKKRSIRVMMLERLLPKKFSSRLFLMAFVAGLIPIVIFTALINTYGKQIEKEFNRIIELGYRQDMFLVEIMLKDMGETTIYNRVNEIAQQLDSVIESVPWMTAEDLQLDSKFRDIAVQSISQTGYTYLFDADSVVVRFHRDKRLEGKDLRYALRGLPDFQAVLQASLKGPNAARGYYQLKAGDGNLMKRFVCIVPLRTRTYDHVRFMVAATVNVEDLSAPVKETEAIHQTTKNYLTIASNQAIQSFRHRGLLLMGIGILTVSLLAFAMGLYFSRAVRRLREAMARINGGDYSTPVPISGSGEVSTLIKDFNKMVDRLGATTVSKQLLQASEARLKVVNNDLRKEIAEREWTEEALAAEKEQLSVTLRSIGDGVITADSEDRVILINNAAERLTGWGQEEAAGLDLTEVFHVSAEIPVLQSGNGGAAGAQNLTELKSPIGQKIFRTRNGAERVIAESRSPICDKSGQILGTVIVFRDITDQKKMEEELLQARKLESLGVLAGGIAHDFNNLLAVVLGNISFAKMFIKPEEKTFGRLTEAEKACMRGKDLTYQLLAFARGGGPLRQTVDIVRLIKDCAMASVTEPSVDLQLSLPDDIFPLRIDENQIRQVLERMFSNAQEAMEKGGVLKVGAENVVVGTGSTLALKQGDYVRILVQDEGPGIEESDLQRIFDPYFTKKQMGYEKGTGLGLSICYAVVKDHGGLITVDSKPGKGTLFHIYLPVDVRHEVVSNKPVTSSARTTNGKGRLLFMDDDEGVRDVIAEMLLHLGYDVVCAKDGAVAIDRYTEAAQANKPFDVVIADLTVRDGMGGQELVEQLHRLDPDVRAVISSGYSNDPVLYDFRKHGFLGVVAKPYKIEELCAVIDQVMQGMSEATA